MALCGQLPTKQFCIGGIEGRRSYHCPQKFVFILSTQIVKIFSPLKSYPCCALNFSVSKEVELYIRKLPPSNGSKSLFRNLVIFQIQF